MQPRRHRMRQRQRRDSAREWIRSGATVTVRTYAKRYGVDRYTAYDDLSALGLTLLPSAQRWGQRPPLPPRQARVDRHLPAADLGWLTVEGRSLFVVGYTPGGAPYGVFDDEVHPFDEHDVTASRP